MSGKVQTAIGPEDVVLSAATPDGAENTFPGKVANRDFWGDAIDYPIEPGARALRVHARPEWDYSISASIKITRLPVKCVGLDA